MKKASQYIIALVFLVVAVGFVVVKYKREKKNQAATFYLLKQRQGVFAQTEEWKQVQQQYAEMMKVVRTNPDDLKSRIALAGIYIKEARVTGNYLYYDMAAMKYINEVLDIDSLNFEALSLKSLCYLSQHHFADGLKYAEKARLVNPYNAFVYGILLDGHVEMGNYDAALTDAEKMVSIRPDLRSYSRISYLREIYGDYPGAIEAMEMALRAGPAGEESTEWVRIQLGHLFENTGDMKRAELNYQTALDNRPGYAYALAGLGRIATASKEYEKAVNYYIKADSLVNDYSFKEALADVYELMGENDKAKFITTSLIEAMSGDAKKGEQDESIGHYSDRELATNYIKLNEYEKALDHALAEYNRRPDNIDVNETVAWVYYKQGKTNKAMPYLESAMKTNCKNPVLLCHAALIYRKAGNQEKAKTLMQDALRYHANIPENLMAECKTVLPSL